MQAQRDAALAALRKSMPEGVRNELIHDQAAGDGDVYDRGDVVDIHAEADLGRIHAVRTEQAGGQVADVLAQVDVGEILGAMQLVVEHGHGEDALAAFPQSLQECFVGEIALLKAKHAANDLKIVLDTMVDFAEENLFLLHRALDLLVGLAAFGHVAEVDGQAVGREIGVDFEPALGGWIEFLEMGGCAVAHDLFEPTVRGTVHGFGEYIPKAAAEDIIAPAHPEGLGLMVHTDDAPGGIDREEGIGSAFERGNIAGLGLAQGVFDEFVGGTVVGDGISQSGVGRGSAGPGQPLVSSGGTAEAALEGGWISRRRGDGGGGGAAVLGMEEVEDIGGTQVGFEMAESGDESGIDAAEAAIEGGDAEKVDGESEEWVEGVAHEIPAGAGEPALNGGQDRVAGHGRLDVLLYAPVARKAGD